MCGLSRPPKVHGIHSAWPARLAIALRSTARASLPSPLTLPQNSNVGSYTRTGFVEVLAAQQSPDNPDWFQGTADAVRQYLWLFKVIPRSSQPVSGPF